MNNAILPKSFGAFISYFLRPYKCATTFYIVLALLAGCWGPLNSLLIKTLIDLLPQVQQGEASILLLPASLLILNVILLDNLVWRGLTYIRGRFLPVMTNHMIEALMDNVLGKSNQFYQDNLLGKLSKQIVNLVDSLERMICTIVPSIISNISLIFIAMIAAYFVNPIFFWILLIWLILCTVAGLVLSKKLISLANTQASEESMVLGELVDALSNHSNVRFFSRQWFERSRMAPFFARQQRAYTATYFYVIIMHTILGGLVALMMACSCYFLIDLYKKNLVTIGDFALILGLVIEIGHMMWYTMSYVDECNEVVGRCKQSLSTLIVPNLVLDKKDARALVVTQGRITFDQVKFNYNGIDPLFQNKSIEIAAGQKVGLVGYSGGGKSTFVNLILRLYDVSDGRILIDDQDIQAVTQDSLRSQVSMIPQDPSLFHRSIMDNIRYGRIDATDEAVIDAAKHAHAHEFIMGLPRGYESLIGEHGVKLSGGQCQRIAIARAILKNAPIFILDEATSQLDAVTENYIQHSLWELMQGKTTLVIAHRLFTLLHMDRILVFDQGIIKEDGTHEALLAQGGLYKKLWNAQVGGFLLDNPE